MAAMKLLIRSMLLVTLFGGVVGSAYPRSASAQTVVRRTVVRRYVYGGGSSLSRAPRYSPERTAFYRAAEQMIRLRIQCEHQQQQERQRREEWARERREQKNASREAARERLRAKTEIFHERDDIKQRAKRAQGYLATAARYEHYGHHDAAIAMYQLAARLAPKAPASAEASRALDRLRIE